MNTETISLVVSTAVLCVIMGQLYMLHKTYKADHERRKKHSTLEFSNHVRRYANEYSKTIVDKYGNKQIDPDDMDTTMENYIRDFLSIVEDLGVGVNTGIYDIEIVNRMYGSYLLDMYTKSLPFIKQQRIKRGTNTLYSEFEDMCQEISKKRRNIPEKGNILHS